MNRIALRANITLVIALLLLAGFVLFIVEYSLNADKWITSEGSPHVYNGKDNINTGVVTDRDDVILLDMRQERTYSNVESIRKSTVHWVGDRPGNVRAPALSQYALDMIGYDTFNGLYSYGDSGGVAKLTLSAQVQAVALEALGDYKGTVAVYNYKTGEILCAVSTPTFDPDNPPEATPQDSFYYNRFAWGLYTPGSIFKIVTLAAALEEIPEVETQIFQCKGEYKIGEKVIRCDDGAHGAQNIKTAFRNSCNCAFAELALQLGGETLQGYVEKFGLVSSLSVDGVNISAGSYSIESEDPDIQGNDYEVAWSSIGQYKDQINPCSFMTFTGAVANGGVMVLPHVVMEVGCDGDVSYSGKPQIGDRILSEETARLVCEYLENNVQTKYGAENFPGLTVGAKTGTAEVDGAKPNAMFAGMVTDEKYPLAFIVAVEDAGYGRTVCVPVASAVLAACKTMIDQS